MRKKKEETRSPETQMLIALMKWQIRCKSAMYQVQDEWEGVMHGPKNAHKGDSLIF